MSTAKNQIPIQKNRRLNLESYIQENQNELDLRKQKISQNPNFKEDIEFISSQLELIKKERDYYKSLLDEHQNCNTVKNIEIQRCNSIFENNFKNETQIEEPQIVDPYSESYGHDLCDRIDKLALQIKNMKQNFEVKSSNNSPLKKYRNDSVLDSQCSLRKKYIETPKIETITRVNNFEKKRAKSFQTLKNENILNFNNNMQFLRKSLNFERTRDDSCFNYHFFNHQTQMELFYPLRIKELELENKKLENILEIAKNQSILSLDRPKNRNSNDSTIKQELEKLQRQLDERSKALDFKEKELKKREAKINRRVKSDRPVLNQINISNTSNSERPRNSLTHHYNDPTQITKIKNLKAIKRDEIPEKGFACNICNLF